jgi:hypothetical protein
MQHKHTMLQQQWHDLSVSAVWAALARFFQAVDDAKPAAQLSLHVRNRCYRRPSLDTAAPNA